jgi:hypothetical protein
MKQLIVAVCALFALTIFSDRANAGDNPVSMVLEGCKVERESYCSEVTLGKGRLLACLYAHGDKISGRCEYALFDAAVQLERAVAALSYAINECRGDLEQHCAGVKAGKGRLLSCLEKNDAQVTNRCKQAIKDVGLR